MLFKLCSCLFLLQICVSWASVWTSATKICFLSNSDEELEDNKALLYLPIAPEVEDPEENPFGPPPDASGLTGSTEDASPSGDKKQRQPSSEMGPAKKKARTTTIELKGVPSDGKLLNYQGHAYAAYGLWLQFSGLLSFSHCYSAHYQCRVFVTIFTLQISLFKCMQLI